jgi:hypothetical protein
MIGVESNSRIPYLINFGNTPMVTRYPFANCKDSIAETRRKILEVQKESVFI